MQEIKFRAWDRKHREMVDVYALSFYPSGELYSVNGRPLGEFDLRSFTGLKDKNGKEIFEGDIVRVFYEGRPAVGKVVYTKDRFIVTIPEDTRKPYYLCLYSHNRIPLFRWSESEVIGNIYENPDLLTTNTKKEEI